MKEPNVKDKSINREVSQIKEEYLRDLRGKCRKDKDDRVNWNSKMVIAHHQRMGVKRYSNFPYVGAPDIPLPETDKIIKQRIPTRVLSSWSPKKLCTVKVQEGIQATPELTEKAKRAEMGVNMCLRSKDQDWFRKLMLASDNSMQYGHCIFKIYEKFSVSMSSKTIDMEDELPEVRNAPSEVLRTYIAERFNLDLEDEKEKEIIFDVVKRIKSGEDIIDFQTPVVKSMPVIDVISPIRITVPAHTTDINLAERIRYEYFLSGNQIERLMEDGIFLKKDLDDVPRTNSRGEDNLTTSMNRSEGIQDNTSSLDLYRMEEICCWYKEKDSKELAKRMVFTFFADVSDTETALVQEIDFPFDFEGWNYEKHDNEIRDSRYYSARGIPEQIRAMQEIMERSINNMIIRDEMLNTPLWEVLDTSDLMDTNVRMAPGAKLGVKVLGQEIKQLNTFPKADTASAQILSTLKAYTEEYLSVSDQLFRNSTNAGGGKTLGEIQIGIQQNAGPLNIEVINWNETLSRVYYKVFLILKDRLGESIYVDGQEIRQEDFDFPAEVRSNGNLEVSNAQLATQKAFARVQVLTDPRLTDIVNSEDRYNTLYDWLEKDGVKDPDRFITDPKVIAQEQIAQLQQQVQQLQQQAMALQNQAQEQVKRAEKAKKVQQDSVAKIGAQNELQSAGAGFGIR